MRIQFGFGNLSAGLISLRLVFRAPLCLSCSGLVATVNGGVSVVMMSMFSKLHPMRQGWKFRAQRQIG
jgi:hypothetical protein